MDTGFSNFQPKLTAIEILRALDGVSYLVSPDGRLLACGGSWDEFSSENGASELNANRLIGADLFSSISGNSVREAYRRMHAAVMNGARSAMTFTFRCDSPERKRVMRMGITPVAKGGEPVALLYQSLVLKEEARPRMGLFDALRVFDDGHPDFPEAYSNDGAAVVRICSFCQRVAWPMAAQGADEWLEPELYYQRGGASDVALSHGICGDCSSSILPS